MWKPNPEIKMVQIRRDMKNAFEQAQKQVLKFAALGN